MTNSLGTASRVVVAIIDITTLTNLADVLLTGIEQKHGVSESNAARTILLESVINQVTCSWFRPSRLYRKDSRIPTNSVAYKTLQAWLWGEYATAKLVSKPTVVRSTTGIVVNNKLHLRIWLH